MGKYSDSSDEYRRLKKSKKSKKHKHRSRSSSGSDSRSVSRDKERARRGKKPRHRRSRSRSSSQSSRSHHHRHSTSHRPHRTRSSRSHSRSRSRSRSNQAIKELLDKVKERERQSKRSKNVSEGVTSEASIEQNLLRQMNKSERLEYKIQKALHAATVSEKDAPVTIKEEIPQGMQDFQLGKNMNDDDVKRQEAINAIDDDEFVASTFISSSTSGLTSTGGSLYRPADAHTAAMFGTAGTSRALMDTSAGGLATGLVTSTIASTAAATNRVKQLTGKQLAGDRLRVPAAVKEKRWLQKLAALRRRSGLHAQVAS